MTLPVPNEFQAVVTSITDAGVFGTSITPGNNTMGTPVQVLTTGAWAAQGATTPGYVVHVEISGVGVSGASKNCFVTIMKDDAGGTNHASATDWLVNLAASHATSVVNGVVKYEFPITCPNGASLFAKAQVDNATVGTALVNVWIEANPTKPWTLRTGTALATLGANTGNTDGATIASATTEPAYVEVATLAADICFIDFGWCVDDSAIQANWIFVDVALGAVTADRRVIADARIFQNTTETIARNPSGRYCEGASGEKVFARAERSSTTTDTAESIVIYVVTGRYTPPNTHTVAGTVTIDGDPADDGEDVKIYAIDTDGIPELITTVQIAGGAGAYTASVPDNTRDYFAVYDDGSSRGVSPLDTPV